MEKRTILKLLDLEKLYRNETKCILEPKCDIFVTLRKLGKKNFMPVVQCSEENPKLSFLLPLLSVFSKL